MDASGACADHVVGAASAGSAVGPSFTGMPVLDFFTGGGNYMPRTHCLTLADGSIDWTWIGILVALTSGVILAYLRIFVFWMRSYFGEQAVDRNRKLFMLAGIFLWCAICGYAMSLVMFAWPAYRLLAVFLLVLNAFSWGFCWDLRPFRKAFTANRLERELAESLRARAAQLETQVAERTAQLEEARARADAASAAKTEFLRNVSHEIRTPLTSILGYADLLMEDGDLARAPEARLRTLVTIQAAGRHLLAVLNDVLDLSKIEAGRMTIEVVPVPLEQVIREVWTLMQPRALERGVRLEMDLQNPVPAIVASDPTRLRQILMNLVGNACKFTDRGRIVIRVSGAPAPGATASGPWMLRFEIEDTGIGMSAEQAARLFQPFSQADTSTTRKFGGTGLGLAIARRLANLLGGDVALAWTHEGRGSCFVADVRVEPAGPAMMTSLTPTPPAGATGGGAPGAGLPKLSGRILLAEDGPDNQRLIAFHLRKAGAEVHVAGDGLEALAAFERAVGAGQPFDLVLTDVQMPGIDGFELASRLRGTVPVVALTAHAMPEDRARCLDAGCVDVATKPIDREVLLKTCARWLGGSTARQGPDESATRAA